MARMIPNFYEKDLKSRGEKELFEAFRDTSGTEDWIVLHSLGIIRHVKRMFGEIDFVVLAPNLGVFCLEVKSGHVKRKDGVWHFTNKKGRTFQKTVGPFEQARDGMFSLIKAVKNRFGRGSRLGNLLFGYGVMFTDIEFKASGPDQEQWLVFDLKSKDRPITNYIQSLHEKTKEQTQQKGAHRILPNKKDIEQLVSFLRKDFDFIIPYWYKEQLVENEIIRLTEEQYYCLDGMQNNKRTLFEGGAGTGKTMLATESARRSALNNKKTLFLCFNNLLADELKKKFKGQELVKVSTFHGLLRSLCNQDQLDESQKDFYTDILPEKAFETLVENGCELFDKLIIDEGQDLIRKKYLDVLDLLLKGGFREGEWQIFCDLKHQAIYTRDSREKMLDLLAKESQFSSFKLMKNCRNTKYIAEHALILSNAGKEAYSVSDIEGPPVDYIFYDNEKDMHKKVLDVLKKLKGEGVNSDSITLLSPYKLKRSGLSTFSQRIFRIHDLTGRKPIPEGSLGFSTIHSYKGLENTYIILVDIDDLETAKIQELLYVGMTRAKLGLYVFIKSNLKERWQSLLVRRILNEKSHH
ncbi:nuclease-related domain-containing DEAD/DEAH box helicase [Lihuaxuella thermophila]|uniref:Type III restriction enzyme, res subunit n=1 Tax=Lihuaxuella thermophila TaxID=1173111 RepID=A0A1H8EJR5_9BACL|nr:ATP-binding domain-containing protein [Lihuaxuella thermophila]SEN19038.1 Type III restriction enzyme, res subunit [Lihuaxuella thermophila]